MAIATFIFDWSGTISDDRRPVYEANMRLLELYGHPRMTFEEWIPKTTLTAREFLANEGITDDPEKIYHHYVKVFNKIEREGLRPTIYPDVENTLEELLKSGKRLFVVSSHPQENLLEEAKKYRVREYFAHIQGNATDKAMAIRELCLKMDVDPISDVSYTGDTVYDIQASKKAGVFAIGISTGYHTRDRLENEKPDKLIGKFSDLLGL